MKVPRGDRVRFVLKRDGLSGGLWKILKRALSYVALSERHIWFVLDLGGARPRSSLPPELTLIRAGAADRELLEQLTTLTPKEAASQISAGNDLWLVLDGGRVLLSMWIFRGHTPSIAAPTGQIPIPPDIVSYEYQEALPAARGRGIAPAANAEIGDALAAEGIRWVICKVAADNKPPQRSAEKTGFQAVALMRFKRLGPRSRVWLEPLDSPLAGEFIELIGPGLFNGRAAKRCER